MTNDEIWHQSTVMERCEILRSRLDSLSTMGPPTIVAQPIEPVLPARPGGIGWIPEKLQMLASLDYVRPEQIERWKRIEAAARDAWFWLATGNRDLELDATLNHFCKQLREALNS